MLILSMRVQEKVFIDLPDGERIVVQLCSFTRGPEGQITKVRIGFDANRNINIIREKALAKREQNTET